MPGGESDSVKHKGSQPLLVQNRAAQTMRYYLFFIRPGHERLEQWD